MNIYFTLKDHCRSGLLKYLQKALINITADGHYNMLDIGCGTGVPTVFIAEHLEGKITAIDSDQESINFLRYKIEERNLSDKVTTQCISFFDFSGEPENFDLVFAEGFLNVVGFENGFRRVMKFLKRGGYFVIHDEFKDHNWKCDFMRENKCEMIDTLFLDETVWWNYYYQPLATAISATDDPAIRQYFVNDIAEIDICKKDPSLFRSIYYVIKKS